MDDDFAEFRPRLFALAYQLLGEVAEAEDAVQDAYLRWHAAEEIVSPRAWLTKVVTNLCLNRLTSARARRERYVGPWFPEPVVTGGTGGPLDAVEQRESVSAGVLLLLERLSPAERAVFVLREAFGYTHREIGELMDVSEAHSRQLHRRARSRIGEDRRRFEVDPKHQRVIVERFLAAVRHGDLQGLHDLLADDVVAWSDGGGKAFAARRPVVGRDRLVRAVFRVVAKAAGGELGTAEINGAPALVAYRDGVLWAVVTFEVEGDRITALRTILNPEKLRFAARQLSHSGPAIRSEDA
ncbi:RNA polymerase sigma-70 factor [Rhizohabitans arisaemae]|uniref:RNA polymerase sigma-70 factor n=1 Tax=Rhizohabitans arisaemae TaxID=2720610 RepID=UPI0024B21D5D|nr:RNA polymerase sigma-70 factor [Rhizohabitans arisaemae]